MKDNRVERKRRKMQDRKVAEAENILNPPDMVVEQVAAHMAAQMQYMKGVVAYQILVAKHRCEVLSKTRTP